MMNRKQIWHSIELYIRSDKKDNPSWPDHAAAQAGKVVAEAGNLMNAAMNMKYQAKDRQGLYLNLMEYSAIRTAALAIRFLENLKAIEHAKTENISMPQTGLQTLD